jgi:Putative sensor
MPCSSAVPHLTTMRPRMSSKATIRRLIATAFSTAPWRAIGFMVLSFALGGVYFVALVAAIAVGLSTLIVWIGVPILVMTMVAWRAAAGAERWRAWRMLGTEIDSQPPAMPRRATAPRDLLRQLGAQATNPASWRELLYLFLMFPVGIAELVVLAAGFSLSIGLLVMPVAGPTGGSGISVAGTHFNSVPASIALGLLGIPVLVLVLNLFVLVARLHAGGARLLLGGVRE